MPNVHCSIELGNQLYLQSGLISLFEIREFAPQKIKSSFPCAGNSGIISIPNPQQERRFYYAVLEIEYYSFPGELDIKMANNRVLQLLTVFSDTDSKIVFSEPITIANIFCFSQLSKIDDNGILQISATNRQLSIASKMRDNFVNINNSISEVIQSSPNGLETNSYAMFNFLANLIYYGITDANTYQQLLSLTEGQNLLECLLNIAKNPFNEVESIYGLIDTESQIYSPSLPELDLQSVPGHPSPIPNQWTLSIKVNDSGSKNFLIGGTGYIVFDKNDRAWVSNNVRQGTGNSSTFCTVLECDGRPASFSPVFGNDLFGGGFGITPDADGEQIFIGNFGWGTNEYMPQFGSISVFNVDGSAIELPVSFREGITRPQGMAFDGHGNLWACSWGSQVPLPDVGISKSVYQYESTNSAVVCFLKDQDWLPVRYELGEDNNTQSPDYQPFDLVIDADNQVYLAAGGHNYPKTPNQNINSSIWKFKLDRSGGTPSIQMLAKYQSDTVESYKQIILNQENEVLVAGQVSGEIIKLDNDLTTVLETFSNNIFSPWGICEDAAGTLFVANFFPNNNGVHNDPEGEAFTYGVAVIHNEDDSTTKLMTLPSGGEEVHLATGMPLYGNTDPPKPCFHPLMRMTCNVPDKVGNLWVTNNWKPSIPIDLTENPGGDGVVIFVGVAQPKFST